MAVGLDCLDILALPPGERTVEMIGRAWRAFVREADGDEEELLQLNLPRAKALAQIGARPVKALHR